MVSKRKKKGVVARVVDAVKAEYADLKAILKSYSKKKTVKVKVKVKRKK